MREDEAYLDVARRYLKSCEEHIANNVNLQEVIGFTSYHAFESIAAAYASHHHVSISRNHRKKLDLFTKTSGLHGDVDPHAVAVLVMIFYSMREKYLYPEKSGASFKRPQDQISITNAKKTVNKVRQIIWQVEKII